MRPTLAQQRSAVQSDCSERRLNIHAALQARSSNTFHAPYITSYRILDVWEDFLLPCLDNDEVVDQDVHFLIRVQQVHHELVSRIFGLVVSLVFCVAIYFAVPRPAETPLRLVVLTVLSSKSAVGESIMNSTTSVHMPCLNLLHFPSA